MDGEVGTSGLSQENKKAKVLRIQRSVRTIAFYKVTVLKDVLK